MATPGQASISGRRWRSTHRVPTAVARALLLVLLAAIASSGQHDAPAWATPSLPAKRVLLQCAAATSSPRSPSVFGAGRASAPFVGSFPRCSAPQEAWADWGSLGNRRSMCRLSVRMDLAGRAGGGVEEGADKEAVCPSCYAPVPGSTVVCPACGDLILLGGARVSARPSPLKSSTPGLGIFARIRRDSRECLSILYVPSNPLR